MYNVEYGSDYAIAWMQNKICRPLQILGKEQILELLEKAWKKHEEEESKTVFQIRDWDSILKSENYDK